MKVHYQIFNHGQIVLWIGDPQRGIKFLATLLKEDVSLEDAKELLKLLNNAEFEEGKLKQKSLEKMNYVS